MDIMFMKQLHLNIWYIFQDRCTYWFIDLWFLYVSILLVYFLFAEHKSFWSCYRGNLIWSGKKTERLKQRQREKERKEGEEKSHSLFNKERPYIAEVDLLISAMFTKTEVFSKCPDEKKKNNRSVNLQNIYSNEYFPFRLFFKQTTPIFVTKLQETRCVNLPAYLSLSLASYHHVVAFAWA